MQNYQAVMQSGVQSLILFTFSINFNSRSLHLQESIQPLPVEDVNKIWEHLRDYGILVGKGGIFGNV